MVHDTVHGRSGDLLGCGSGTNAARPQANRTARLSCMGLFLWTVPELNGTAFHLWWTSQNAALLHANCNSWSLMSGRIVPQGYAAIKERFSAAVAAQNAALLRAKADAAHPATGDSNQRSVPGPWLGPGRRRVSSVSPCTVSSRCCQHLWRLILSYSGTRRVEHQH